MRERQDETFQIKVKDTKAFAGVRDLVTFDLVEVSGKKYVGGKRVSSLAGFTKGRKTSNLFRQAKDKTSLAGRCA